MKRFDQIWYGNNATHYLLIPFSLLYQSAVFIRRLGYKLGLRKITSFPVPIIIVGNITVGGTGKTPLVIYLAQFLKQQGFKPGVVSRGYGGKATVYPQFVTQNSDAYLVGDEPLLIAQQTGVPVVVAPKRVDGVASLLSQTHCNIVISDDGLQHYALARDIEIAVLDGKWRFGNGFCLPAGPLREPKSRLKTVDFTVVNGNYAQENESKFCITLEDFVSLNEGSIQKDSKHFLGKQLHAIAGIANPQRFFATLRRLKLEFVEHVFPDHYAFKKKDIEFGKNATVLMTEKDAVKCRKFAVDNCWYLPITIEVDKQFLKKLLQRLTELSQVPGRLFKDKS